MLAALRSTAGLCFYLLGASFLVGVVLLQTPMAAEASYWMQIADLPLAFSAVVFGGVSLYMSVHPTGKSSPFAATILMATLGGFFSVLVALNFWGVIL